MGDSECILVSKDASASGGNENSNSNPMSNMRRRRVQTTSNQSAAASSQGVVGAAIDEDDYAKTVNLIKQVQGLRARGSMGQGLKVLEETLKLMDA